MVGPKEYNMFAGRNGTGLIKVEGNVDPHLIIPELAGMKIPLSVMEDVEAFHDVLLKMIRCKAEYETIYHVILEWIKYV